jgi:hypothetical protein
MYCTVYAISLRGCSSEYLLTKADLEGGYHGNYEGDASKELGIVPKVVKARPMIARISCLFASLKVSGGFVPELCCCQCQMHKLGKPCKSEICKELVGY